jgi:hypothetical protein
LVKRNFDVIKMHNTTIKIKKIYFLAVFSIHACLPLEDRGKTLPRNCGTYVPKYTVSIPQYLLYCDRSRILILIPIVIPIPLERGQRIQHVIICELRHQTDVAMFAFIAEKAMGKYGICIRMGTGDSPKIKLSEREDTASRNTVSPLPSHFLFYFLR